MVWLITFWRDFNSKDCLNHKMQYIWSKVQNSDMGPPYLVDADLFLVCGMTDSLILLPMDEMD